MREYLLVLCVAAAVTYLLTPLARRFAIRVGAMAEPRDRDVHAIPTPRLGGLAMYGGVCAAFWVASSLPALSRVFRYSDVEAVVVGGGLIVLLGIADDRWGIDALTKLAGQVLACGVMVLNGLELLTLTLPGVAHAPTYDAMAALAEGSVVTLTADAKPAQTTSTWNAVGQIVETTVNNNLMTWLEEHVYQPLGYAPAASAEPRGDGRNTQQRC